MDSIIDSLQSGLLMFLIALWGVGLGLMYVIRVFHRWTVKIANLSRQREKTYSGVLVDSFEPSLLKIENRH